MTVHDRTIVREQPRSWGSFSGLEVPGWASEYGLVAGITDRATDFRLPERGGPLAAEGFLATMREAFTSLVVSRQVHGSRVRHTEHAPDGVSRIDGFDGHVTAAPGVLLTVTVADCVPVYVAQPSKGAVALLHAGWRGIASGILEVGISRLREISAAPRDAIVMHCGVAICGDCYEVGPEVLDSLDPRAHGGAAHMDLRALLVARAARLGVEHVTVSGWCSAHHQARFHSHRRSRGADGRQVAFLGRPAP